MWKMVLSTWTTIKTNNPGLMAAGDFKVHQVLIEKHGDFTMGIY